MNVWIEQWYLTIPDLANADEKLAPGFGSPLSKDPLSAVTVWAILSVFFQVTFWRTFVVAVAGWKAKFWIVAAMEPPDVPAAVVGAADG
jgi:hypothetical protein